MKLRREEKGAGESGGVCIVFEEIEPFFLDLLRRLPWSADPRDDAAVRRRLFSPPMHPADETGEEFNDEWKEYVEPDLRDLFRSARETVENDLADLPEIAVEVPLLNEDFNASIFLPTSHALAIPIAHADAWLNTLNQARLAIAARSKIGEQEMSRERPFPPFDKAADFELYQIHFYDDLQQILLSEMGYD